MIPRVILLVAALFATFGAAPGSSQAAPKPSPDRQILGRASLLVGHERAAQVATWLSHQQAVGWARVGKDGHTLDVRFRDGFHAMVLPKRLSTTRLPIAPRQRSFQTLSHLQQTPSGKALVLEPYAAELGLGSYAGAAEYSDLQSAGFQVDQAYDTNVTVATMATLPSYNVVYMHTHSGVGYNGDGVLATGQPATLNPDSSIAGLIQDGSVVVVTVSGTLQEYYAITTRYITYHEGSFPHDSLFFFNGCSFLQATAFWQAMATKGAGVLLSWDQESATSDDYTSAQAFFGEMGQGKSVADALTAIRSQGLGTSSASGVTSTMGYLGDGTITLQRAKGGQGTGSPSPTATTPSGPSPSPTAGPPPTSTTPVVVTPPLAAVLKAAVKPGSSQVITATSHPNTPVRLEITFPNGDRRSYTQVTNAQGTATFRFAQPGSEITHSNAVATVTIQAGSGVGVATLTKQYRIGLGKIDVSAAPRVVAPGQTLTIWVHTTARKAVHLAALVGAKKLKGLSARAGRKGWVHKPYRVSRGLKSGAVITVRASVHLGKRTYQTGTTASVK
jgi:hypothetical protein